MSIMTSNLQHFRLLSREEIYDHYAANLGLDASPHEKAENIAQSAERTSGRGTNLRNHRREKLTADDAPARPSIHLAEAGAAPLLKDRTIYSHDSYKTGSLVALYEWHQESGRQIGFPALSCPSQPTTLEERCTSIHSRRNIRLTDAQRAFINNILLELPD